MTVPSYDDLTPGIPDVVDSETAQRLTSVLRELPAAGARLPASAGPPASGVPCSAFSATPALFACLRLDTGSAALERALAVARDFSPRVMRASDDEVLLDVSGLGRLIGEPPEIARQLSRAMAEAGVAGRVALAPTQTRARLLAMSAGRAAAVVQDDLAGLAVPLLKPLEILPPAMNHRDRDRPYEIFATWGIATLGDLAALPPGDLSARLGRRGAALHRLARGIDAAPFVPDAATPRYIGRIELEWPIDALEPLSFVFARLLDPLATALERADRGAAAIRLELRLTDRSTHTRLLQLPAAMRDPRVLRTLLLLDLESQPAFAADVMIDVVTIELDPAPARITQFSLLRRALPSPETLSTLTARLTALVGEGRVGSAVVVDSHRPDAIEMRRYAPEGAAGVEGARGKAAAVLRRQRGSLALQVSVEHGRPVHLASSRRGIPYGAIAQAAGPWRTSGGWWLVGVSPTPRSVPRRGSGRPELSSKGGAGGWNRNEWDVALKSGAVCRIFQDRTTDRWFLEGIYD